MADAEQRAEATHATIARSAAVQKSSAERTTELAADRTVLAAERTYAAWVRTGLASLAAGIGARKLLDGLVPDTLALAGGFTLVLFSGFCFAAAVWREVWPDYRDPQPDTRRLPSALLLLVNGILTLVSLAAAAGLVATG